MSVHDKLPIPTTVFPIATRVNCFKDPLQQDLSCQRHLLVRLGVSGLRATRDRSCRCQMEKTQPESTRPDSQMRAPSTMPGAWKSQPCHSLLSFSLKKRKKGKRKSQDSMILSGLSLSASPCVSEEEWERQAPGEIFPEIRQYLVPIQRAWAINETIVPKLVQGLTRRW